MLVVIVVPPFRATPRKGWGIRQVFLSPGVMLGKMHLWKRLNMSIGEGVQIPVTHFHTVDRTWLTSVRFPF